MIPCARHGLCQRPLRRWYILERCCFFHDAGADITDNIRVTQDEIARHAAGVSNLTIFKAPNHQEPFEKQRISGLNSRRMDQVGLKRFEPCPAGYTFVDADLGGGAFARVFLVRNEATHDLQAMKRVDRLKLSKHFQISDAEAEKMVEQEFWNMQRTNHPHIIKLFDFFQDERYAYFIMESVNGGTLRQLITTLVGGKGPRISEGYVAELLHQALYALRHLHHESRIHKDVKLENLMLLANSGPPHLVLIDLGVAETLQPQGVGPMPAGTPQTMAPEVIDCMLGERSSEFAADGFDDRCDIFSLGIVAHQLFTGDVPYKVAYTGGKSYGPVDYKATRANMDAANLTAQLNVSDGALDFVRQMLQLDPEKRPSSLECLEHPWLVERCERRRIRRLRAEGRTSLGGVSLSVEAEEAAGEELLWMERRRICKALVRFAKRTPLQRAVAYHLAAYLPVGDLRRAADSFKRVDHSKSGHISYDEIAQALEEVLGIERENGLLVAAAMDTDKSNQLDFQEFSAALAIVSGEREQRLFDKLLAKLQICPDQDLTLEQVHHAVQQAMRQEVTREEIVQWLSKVARRQQKELYDNPAGIVSNADFRKLFGQRSLK